MDATRLASIERQEAMASRSDPRGGAILADAQAAYLELSIEAMQERSTDTGIALLADVVRLGRYEGVDAAEERRRGAARAQEIASWTATLHASDPEPAWIRWLANHSVVSLLEMVQLAMPSDTDTNLAAMRAAIAAARALDEPAPRLLGLHQLAAALWQRGELGELEAVIDELDAIDPLAYRGLVNRAHVAIARGGLDEAKRLLEAARMASPRSELDPYLRLLSGSLAAARGDLGVAREELGAIPEGIALILAHESDLSRLPPTIELVCWEQPAFVYDVEHHHELAIALWKRLPEGRAHARFVAERLFLIDPRAQWRRWQGDQLGVPFRRTHEAAIAELLDARRRVVHPRFGEGIVLRELEGAKLEIEFVGAGRKVLLASSVS